jgi:ferredoxin-NADP reductase
MPGHRLLVELLDRSPLSSRVHRLRFAPRLPFRWAAGQHLLIVGCQGQELFLPYSIASAFEPEKPGEFELAVSVPSGSPALDALSPGSGLLVEGPFGEFVWQSAPNPAALLVGVGTGIAPLRALIQEELARASKTRLLLLAGHRAPDDVLFGNDFGRLDAEHARFRFLPTLTLAGSDWGGQHGRVQAQLLAATHALGPLDAYVCGRIDMVNEVAALLEAHGVARQRIRSEGF